MRPSWPHFVWPAPVVLWFLIALGHLASTWAAVPARIEEPALLAALACGALSLGIGWRGHPYRRAPWTRLEAALGVASLIAAGVTLGAEADSLIWPLPVHPAETPVVIEGRVLDTTATDAEFPSLVVEARRVRVGSREAPCRAKLTVRWRDDAIPPRWVLPGLWLRLRGDFRPPEDARNPGSSAPGRALERLGLAGTVTIDPLSIEAPADPPERGSDPGAIIRDRLARAFAASLSRPVAALARGMLLGDRSGIAPAIQHSFRDGGTVHILSISGLHVCILAGFIALFAGTLRLPPAPTAAIELAALWGYVALVGAPASALRSALLWTSSRCGRLLGVVVRPFTAWGIAGLALHLADPRSVLDPGFQLSFLAVLGLGAAGPLGGLVKAGASGGGLRGLARRAAAGGWSLFVQSGGATIGTAGVQSTMFGAIPMVGLGLNLVVIPLCTLFMAECVLFLGAAATGMPLLRDAAAGALEASGLLMLELNTHGSRALDPWLVHGVAPLHALALGALFLALAGAAAESCRGGRTARPSAARWSAMALFVGALVPFVPAPRRAPSGPAIVMLDIGQGDATWVSLPGGGSLLVDAGPRDERRDSGESVIEPALRAEGAGRIANALLSHAHLDHFGGFEWLARRGWIGTLWENGRDRRGAWRRGLSRALARRGGRALGVARDTTLALGGGASLTIERGIADGPHENDASLAAILEVGGATALFAGDLETDGEEALLPRLGPVDVVKAPHHGSKTSSGEDWVAKLHPSVVLVSSGEHNRFHHPNPTVLGRYERWGAQVLRTDQEGAIRLTLAPGGAWISTRAHPAPERLTWNRGAPVTPSREEP
ncbi:MAG TPA: ComEC/Rec2 family competence protein [Candidatus Eisenbacteria bacterium]|nr:ComEC/Rec2 family competence protein [Candidatus Eisenbacteria bacterium]